jgi:hypothetical protein
MRNLALLSLLLLSGACASIPRPPVAVQGRHGEARAATVEKATALVELLDRQAPAVQAALGEFNRSKPSVWFVTGGKFKAVQCENCIVLRTDAMVVPEYFLTHELVHWYAVGTPWRRLPKAVEEGLADFLTCRIARRYELDRRRHHRAARAAVREGHVEVDFLRMLREDREDWGNYTALDHDILYAFGFTVVERIGVEGLYQLCLDHEDGVPPALLLERARLTREGGGW